METKQKTFTDLNKINVSDKLEKKDGLSYLSWSYAWEALKSNFLDANYKVYENSEGMPYFKSAEGFIVKVGVSAGGVEHISYLPVMNSSNKAMKSEAYKYTTKSGERSVNAADMMDINKTIQRALVKAIALHGIGLYVYSGEDMPTQSEDVIVNKKVMIVIGVDFDDTKKIEWLKKSKFQIDEQGNYFKTFDKKLEESMITNFTKHGFNIIETLEV